MGLLVFCNTYLVTPALLAVLIGAGGWLFFVTRGRPLLTPHPWVRSMLSGNKQHGAQSPFRALCVALAGTLGVGNIVGVATAIHLGGAGALFWMWVSALFAAVIKYSETVLAVYFGGNPMVYMRNGLGAKVLPALFAGICLISSLFLGNCLQTQAVTDACATVWHIPPAVTASVFAGVVLLVTIGGIKRISSVTTALIPALSLVFLAGCVGLMWQFRAQLPAVFHRIFTEAFSLRSVGSGMGGYLLFRGMRLGTMRGLLSNEAGCGTAPMAHATAEGTLPAEQGFWGVLEVCIDTLLLCTVSGVSFLLFPELCNRYDGMELAIRAFRLGYGGLSDSLLAIAITLFALASVVAWSYYGTSALSYFTKRKATQTVYLFLYGSISALSFLLSSDLLWEITDLAIGIMTILNTLSVLALRRVVADETARFFA